MEGAERKRLEAAGDKILGILLAEVTKAGNVAGQAVGMDPVLQKNEVHVAAQLEGFNTPGPGRVYQIGPAFTVQSGDFEWKGGFGIVILGNTYIVGCKHWIRRRGQAADLYAWGPRSHKGVIGVGNDPLENVVADFKQDFTPALMQFQSLAAQP